MLEGEGGAASPSPEVISFGLRTDRLALTPLSRRPERLSADLIELRRAINVLELKFSELAAAFAELDSYELAGFTSPIGWLRANCNVSGNMAADRICVGEQAELLGQSAEAISNGEIGFAHLSLMAHATRASVEAEGRTLTEADLLPAALEMGVWKFRNFCQHSRHAADPEGFAENEQRLAEDRYLDFSRGDDGVLYLRGQLDPVGGATLRTVLEPLARKHGKSDDRHRNQRLADALVELAQGNAKGVHLQVTASLETLRGLPGAAAGELELAPPISAKTVARFACDCTLTRVILGADSVVIDVGRGRRVVAGPTKRALHARDQHCAWPGCQRPPSSRNCSPTQMRSAAVLPERLQLARSQPIGEVKPASS